MEQARDSRIDLALYDLIEQKKNRDGKFTRQDLANAIGVNPSILTRIAHADPMKRQTNPQLHTLQKIVEFFQLDGFDITLNDLIQQETQRVVFSENTHRQLPTNEITIPLFELYSDLNRIGKITTDVEVNDSVLVGFKSDEFIPPFFKKGTVFVANRESLPEVDNLVVVKSGSSGCFQLRKVAQDEANMKIYLIDVRNPHLKYEFSVASFIGVVHQINAKI